MKSLVRSLGINFVGVIFVAASGFVSVMLMARWLETAQFGTVSLLLLLFNSIAILDGVRPVLVMIGAKSPDFRALIRAAELTMSAAGLAVACLCIGALTISGRHIDVLHGILFSLTLGMYFPLSAYWGLLDSRGETAFTGGARSAALTTAYVAFAALAWLRADLRWYVVAMMLMNAGLLVAYGTRLYTLHARGSSDLDWALIRRIWGDAANNLVFNVSAFVLGSLDRFVLGSMRGSAELGLYSGPYELTTKPTVFLRVLAAVLYPEAARRHGDSSFGDFWLRVLKLLFFAVTCAAFLAVMYRAEIVHLLLGEKFAAAADSFGILSVGFTLASAGYLAAIPLQAAGDFRTLRSLYLAAACLMGIFVWPAIALGGINGAAALYLSTRLVDVFVLLAAFKKIDKKVSFWRALVVSTLFCLLMMAAWYRLAAVGIVLVPLFAVAVGVPQLAMRLMPARYSTRSLR